jgi:hypothetical protein
MKLIKHKSGGWLFFVPAKLTADGKRKMIFRKNYNQANEALKRYKSDLRAHGRAAVSDEERTYISMARQELGDLKRLPEVLRHWKLTGPDACEKTTLTDAVKRFLDYRGTLGLDRRTVRDSASHMRQFSRMRPYAYVHEIPAAEIREYLEQRGAPATKKTAFKHLRLFWAWAKQERLVATNPMTDIKAPIVRAKEAEVYGAEDFEKVLRTADSDFRDLVPFLCLSGFGFQRTGELVSVYADRPVMKWEHILWDENKVYVPELVAKQTRRAAGNKREYPICDAIRHWLEPYKGRTGRIVELNESEFRDRMSSLFKAAGVAKLDNGLRKSAISHYIAKFPETGVVLTAWYAGNSEAVARTHYLAWLSQEAGERWFGIRRAS